MEFKEDAEKKSNEGRNRLLYFTAPSRSGSSLLVTILNCLKQVVVVNEPLNSYRIDKKDIVDSVFNSIIKDAKNGYVMQRLDKEEKEVTDTFPSENISWQKQRVDFYPNSVIGIKKSFPSLGNKDYYDVFINEWESFVEWFVGKRNGKILVIIRNPIYTILSWKTTFEALRSETQRQCEAWNRIASAILKTKNNVYILKYEDLVNNTNKEIRKITDFLGVEFTKTKGFPQIRRNYNTLDYYVKIRTLMVGNIEEDLMMIGNLCTPVACEFGYDLSKEIKKLGRSFFKTNLYLLR